ncbi:MAG: AI-2E family transporter [Pseudorhodoplanes sp.]|nr:AI-2E family transporter [Pseudorhodoplanes sp.]
MNVEPNKTAFDSGGWRKLRMDIRGAEPLADRAAFWRAMAQAATVAMAVILIGTVLFLARSLIIPVVCAGVIAMTVAPISNALSERGIPTWLPAIVVVAGIGSLLYVATVSLADPISQLIAHSSEIGNTIKDKFQFLDRPLAALKELKNAVLGNAPALSVDVNQADVIQNVLSVATPAVLAVVLFFATLFFFIFGREDMQRYAVRQFGSRDGRLRALRIINDIEANLSAYLITVTGINVAVGLVAAGIAFMMGLPGAILWGAVAFVLNYIPYIGPGMVVVGLFGAGLLTFDTLLPALVAPLLFVAFTFVEGHFVTPAIVGRRLLMHPLAVFLSLAFWSWLWGPIGAFLATPLLIIAFVAMRHLYPGDKANLPG